MRRCFSCPSEDPIFTFSSSSKVGNAKASGENMLPSHMLYAAAPFSRAAITLLSGDLRSSSRMNMR